MSTNLWQRNAGELARMIAGRQVTSAEVVEAHLARIKAVNPAVNAIVRVLADEARAGAALARQWHAARCWVRYTECLSP